MMADTLLEIGSRQFKETIMVKHTRSGRVISQPHQLDPRKKNPCPRCGASAWRSCEEKRHPGTKAEYTVLRKTVHDERKHPPTTT